jgi:hypothetical protein
MKTLLLLALGAGLLCPAAARAEYDEEGLTEAAVSSDTAKNADDEEEPLIQENDSDLADFVTDYIRKDIQLKGAFFIEDKVTKRILKLELSAVENKASDSEGGTKKLAATLKDAVGKKFTVLFYLHNGPWGGLDISKIELKSNQEKPKPAKK